MTPVDYGGRASTYAGIMAETDRERLWELYELDQTTEVTIVAGERYNDVC